MNRRAALLREEGLQTLTPTRHYTEQRGGTRGPGDVRSHQVIARGGGGGATGGGGGGGRGARPQTASYNSDEHDGDSEEDWQAGFEMFVEKCADGTETDAELRRRWSAMSNARQSTWTRLGM